MKILARDLKTTVYPTGGVGIAFDTSNYAKADIQALKRGDYEITIRKPRDKRSLNQNNYLWEIIGQIGMKINGNHSEDEEIYTQILDMAGAKIEYIQCLPATVPALQQLFRIVKFIENRGKTNVYKCYFGTSKMDVTEMNTVIDKTLEYASEVGIDTEYWKALLKEEEDGQSGSNDTASLRNA